MKKLFTLLTALVITLSANAQFEKGKTYVGASFTGADLSYSSSSKLHLGLDASAGYFIEKNVLAKAVMGLNLQGEDNGYNSVKLGVGARYYLEDNGIFFGAELDYLHSNTNYNDFTPEFEVGYAFFVNKSVTIEPAVYYRQALSNNDFSRFGVRIGVGIYLDTHKKGGTIFN